MRRARVVYGNRCLRRRRARRPLFFSVFFFRVFFPCFFSVFFFRVFFPCFYKSVCFFSVVSFSVFVVGPFRVFFFSRMAVPLSQDWRGIRLAFVVMFDSVLY